MTADLEPTFRLHFKHVSLLRAFLRIPVGHERTYSRRALFLPRFWCNLMLRAPTKKRVQFRHGGKVILVRTDVRHGPGEHRRRRVQIFECDSKVDRIAHRPPRVSAPHRLAAQSRILTHRCSWVSLPYV